MSRIIVRSETFQTTLVDVRDQRVVFYHGGAAANSLLTAIKSL